LNILVVKGVGAASKMLAVDGVVTVGKKVRVATSIADTSGSRFVVGRMRLRRVRNKWIMYPWLLNGRVWLRGCVL
jgi:hypothetical protein